MIPELNWLMYGIVIVMVVAVTHIFTRKLPKATQKKLGYWIFLAALVFSLLLFTLFVGIDFMRAEYNWVPVIIMTIVATLVKVFSVVRNKK